jgi:hypothetical protein
MALEGLVHTFLSFAEPCAFKDQLFKGNGEISQQVAGCFIQNQIGSCITRFFKANCFAWAGQKVFDIEVTRAGESAEKLG